jgi:ssDNA-binding Zn-finger/Zn-ribbon topoisomerase 1
MRASAGWLSRRLPPGGAGAESEREVTRLRNHSNDDKSPLIGLLNCIVCKETMKIEKSEPDTEGKDIIQYRCEQCGRIERVRLFRRSRDAG